MTEAGRGELNQAAEWDDFPNGRFGDFKSPAFGDYDAWGNMGISVGLGLTAHYPYLPTSLHSARNQYGNGATPKLLKTLQIYSCNIFILKFQQHPSHRRLCQLNHL
jgi:hypothetical protein